MAKIPPQRARKPNKSRPEGPDNLSDSSEGLGIVASRPGGFTFILNGTQTVYDDGVSSSQGLAWLCRRPMAAASARLEAGARLRSAKYLVLAYFTGAGGRRRSLPLLVQPTSRRRMCRVVCHCRS